jgi:hypothetical protein
LLQGNPVVALWVKKRRCAEIAQEGVPGWVDQQVMGIQIAVENAALMQVNDGRRGVAQNAQGFCHDETTLLGIAVARAAGE